jgi:O-antigen/teichoic acid export membrane protein
MNEHSVGLYAVGIRLVEAVYFLPIIIVASIFPAIVSAKDKGDYFFYKRLQFVYTLMVWMGAFISIIIMLFSNELIYLLFGAEYQESSEVLLVYSLVIIPLFLSVANDKWFYVEDKGYLLSIKIFLGAISNVILNYFLIPIFGLVGAAYATVISFYISVVLSDLIFQDLYKILALKLKAFFPIYLLKETFK